MVTLRQNKWALYISRKYCSQSKARKFQMVLFNSEFIGVFDIKLQKHRKSAATRPLGTFHHPETINVMNVIISRRRVWKITPPQNEIYTWRTENERFAMCGTCTQWLIIDTVQSIFARQSSLHLLGQTSCVLLTQMEAVPIQKKLCRMYPTLKRIVLTVQCVH